ncbi:ABC transporter permease [Streptomyces sp. H27-D2]|uniref:ABC transporter permease n=1 Tax=Streptomyces sp. H27-D2 TaxID=3046304 RepID=UPI002DB6B692|nr:ABC transporter permease [Streptomyces sp. H27-D2]MEC4020712.1 ABC transporter permease [Streptomyces sp. H27-D2]
MTSVLAPPSQGSAPSGGPLFGAPAGRSAGLADVVALTGRHLRHLRRTPEKIIAVALTPVAMVVILGYLFASVVSIGGDTEYHDYVMAGVFTQVGLSCVGITALGVASDLSKGLIDRFRSLPMARPAVLVSHTAADLVPALISMAAVGGVGLLVGWRIERGILPALAGFALLLAFAYAMLWLGALLGMVLRNMEAINGISALVLVVFSFLSNSFMPLTGLPDWLRTVAEWNPVSSVSEACRVLWGNAPAAQGGSLPVEHPVLVSVLTVGAMIAVLVPVCLRTFRTASVR